jgi:hypothetical protein
VTFRNLTPHRLVVVDAAGAALLTLPPCPAPPRVDQEVVDEVVLPTGVMVRGIRYGPVSGLPDPTPGVVLVVSRVVAREVERADLVFPDGEVRDAEGRIIGCRRLARFRSRSGDPCRGGGSPLVGPGVRR